MLNDDGKFHPRELSTVLCVLTPLCDLYTEYMQCMPGDNIRLKRHQLHNAFHRALASILEAEDALTDSEGG